MKGFDICPANQVLNYIAQFDGLEYDEDGNLARTGKQIDELASKLNQFPFYELPFPKSLSNEMIRDFFFPLVKTKGQEHKDLLYTATNHIGSQIGQNIEQIFNRSNINSVSNSIFITGGGARNTFLIETINRHISDQLILIVPNLVIVDFKEAVLMAFAGLLRDLEIPNFIHTVTGASRNALGGIIYLPNKA